MNFLLQLFLCRFPPINYYNLIMSDFKLFCTQDNFSVLNFSLLQKSPPSPQRKQKSPLALLCPSSS